MTLVSSGIPKIPITLYYCPHACISHICPIIYQPWIGRRTEQVRSPNFRIAPPLVFPISNHDAGQIKEQNWYGPNGMEHLRTVKEPKQSIPTFAETVALLMMVRWRHANLNGQFLTKCDFFWRVRVLGCGSCVGRGVGCVALLLLFDGGISQRTSTSSSTSTSKSKTTRPVFSH